MPPYYSILPLAAGSPYPLINPRSPLVVQSDRIPSKRGWRVESLGGATVHMLVSLTHVAFVGAEKFLEFYIILDLHYITKSGKGWKMLITSVMTMANKLNVS